MHGRDESQAMISIYIMGKRYDVPESLTIMKAIEYAGYKLIRGCGCRGGFCGACATVYRVEGDPRLHFALACQEVAQPGMYLVQIPFFPLRARPTGWTSCRPRRPPCSRPIPGSCSASAAALAPRSAPKSWTSRATWPTR